MKKKKKKEKKKKKNHTNFGEQFLLPNPRG